MNDNVDVVCIDQPVTGCSELQDTRERVKAYHRLRDTQLSVRLLNASIHSPFG